MKLSPPQMPPGVGIRYDSILRDLKIQASRRSQELRLVCQGWRRFLAPIFWEDVFVRQSRQLGASAKLRDLRDVVEESSREDPEGEGVGQLIRDLTLDLAYLSLPDVGRIIRRCTRLRRLTIILHNDWNRNTIPDHLIPLPSNIYISGRRRDQDRYSRRRYSML